MRAVAASEIPLISAIGHETDTTLIDLVSDVRAPTPTAAAEIAVPVLSEISHNLNKIEHRKWRQLKQKLSHSKQRFVDVSRSMPRGAEICALPSQRLDITSERLPRGLLNLIQRNKLQSAKILAGFHPRFLKQMLDAQHERMVVHSQSLFVSFQRNSEKKHVHLKMLSNNIRSNDFNQSIKRIKVNFRQMVYRLLSTKSNLLAARFTKLESLDRLRETLGYKETLNRGYSVVRAEGSVMTSVSAVVNKPQIEVEFRDGRIGACITETATNEKKQVTKAKDNGKIKGIIPTQGSLF